MPGEGVFGVLQKVEQGVPGKKPCEVPYRVPRKKLEGAKG